MTASTSRAQLEGSLSTAGIRVMPQGAVNPPSVFVFPDTPWIEASALGLRKRAIHWVIMCIVSAGSEVSISDAETLAEAIDVACRTLPDPWGLPTIYAPGYLALSGLPYIAFRVEIRTLI